MTGAVALVAAAALVALGSFRLAALVSPRSAAPFLLTAYLAAWTQLVLVLWAMSAVGKVTRWWLLVAFAIVCAAVALATRRRSDIGARLRNAGVALADGLAEPVAAVVGLAVVAGLAYAIGLGLATPQNDFDTIVDHLWRAGLWLQNGAAGYPDCACAPYINAYPPHGELGVLATMALGGSDRYVTLVQATAYVALVTGVVGVGRGLGLGRAESLVGGLLVATLPVIALQASTAQNDLLVASFVVAAAAFLLDRGRAAPWLAGAATGLAVGTKLTALIGLPLLLVIAFVSMPARRCAPRLAAVLLGAAVGSYWYVVNWAHTGSWDGGFPSEEVDHGAMETLARGLRSAIQFVELPGAAGRDRWLYVIVALIVLVAFAVFAARSGARRPLGFGVAAAAVTLMPVFTPDVRRYLDQAYRDLWRALGRDDIALQVGRDITISASNVTWYGPLGALLVVVGLVVGVVAARRRTVPWVAVLLAGAPVYWLVTLSVVLFYQDAAGRFLMAPMALAGATWGLSIRVRPVAWGLAGIGVTALALAVLNDTKRPSGLPLLERPSPASYWSSPRWQAQGNEVHVPDLIRFVDEQVPSTAGIGLAITPSDPGYVFFGPDLDRRLELLVPGAADAPDAQWVFVSPGAYRSRGPRLCPTWKQLSKMPDGWHIYRRTGDC